MSPRRARKAERGEIHQVLPNTSTRESRRDYANRMSQQAFIERAVASSRRRKIAFASVFALVALVVAGCAAWFVFLGGIDDRLQIEDASLSAVLADAPAEGVAYTLLSASYDDGDGGAGPDAALLVRTDAEQASASVLTIPGNTKVMLSDGQEHRLGEAEAIGGAAEAVSAVEGLSGVQISHYVAVDAQGFSSLVDALGGIEVDLPEAVSDPDAGTIALPAGAQTLSGEQAVFLCRANDFVSSAEQRRGLNDALVVQALFKKFIGMDSFDFYTRMDALADFVKTDMDAKAAYALLSSLKDIAAESILTGVMPTYLSKAGGAAFQVPISDEWEDMLVRFTAGEPFQQDKQDIIGSVDPASFTITVNNGGSVEGAAADASSVLEGAGFKVSSVGNANQAVYDDTLVIYQKDDDESRAEALVAALGVGRAVLDSVNYAFDTDILVVVGKDWQDVLDARDRTQGQSAS
ncbi:MAG: LCP family protein [Slackia sp.]|nr:LCP family protein [Slackia sp.]